jgi:hypothetical protein
MSMIIIDWVNTSGSRLDWATGIGCIDAAMVLVDEAISNSNIEGDV